MKRQKEKKARPSKAKAKERLLCFVTNILEYEKPRLNYAIGPSTMGKKCI